jgi:hypothetical protein
MHDDLSGERMKAYEYQFRMILPTNSLVIIRLDADPDSWLLNRLSSD